jgi:hypothetical protein
VKAHVALAFLNILGAATMGILLGLDRLHPILSGYVLTNVFAHAHLAAIGWASLMVVGLAYRLLPMVLPAAMPDGLSLYASAILLEGGVIGLFVSLLKESRWTPLFGGLVVAGFGMFLGRVIWMTRHRRPAPVRRPQPDYGVRHVAVALIYLAVACVLGLTVALSPMTDWTLHLAAVYGVCGLIGFLAQIIVGVQTRILPTFAWYHAFARAESNTSVPPPDALARHELQAVIFWLWLFGVPALAAGFAFDAIPCLAAGAWLLFTATIASACDAAWMFRGMWRTAA